MGSNRLTDRMHKALSSMQRKRLGGGEKMTARARLGVTDPQKTGAMQEHALVVAFHLTRSRGKATA
jgi:hypothetical protein